MADTRQEKYFEDAGKDLKTIPLTDSEQGIYFACLENPDSDMYNVSFVLDLPESIDTGKFAEAVKKAASMHPDLFSVFKEIDGHVVKVINPDAEPIVTFESIEESGGAFAEENETAAMKQEQKQELGYSNLASEPWKALHANSSDGILEISAMPFDLEKGPLYRFMILSTPNGTIFLLEVHHIIFDGMSFNVLINQIADAYDGRELKEENLSMEDIAAAEKELRESSKYKKAQEFFEEKLGGKEFDNTIISDVTSISEYNENSAKVGAGNCGNQSSKQPCISPLEKKAGTGLVLTMAEEKASPGAIENFTKKTGIKKSTLFYAAFAYALRLFTGTNESCFTSVHYGRKDARLNNSVGMFVRTMPFCFEIDEEKTVREFLDEVQNTVAATTENNCISFGELIRNYGANDNIGFAYQSGFLSEVNIGGEKIMPCLLPTKESGENILCMAIKSEEGYILRTEYKKDIFSQGLMESFNETIMTVLEEMLAKEYLKDIQPAGEKSKELFDEVNATEKPYDPAETVNSMLDEQIRKHPDKRILFYKDENYTFEEFDKLTKKTAAYIKDTGINKNEFVAVLGERNARTVISAWGVIRSGAALQTIDPTYPKERIDFMLEDTGAKLVILDRKLENLIEGYKEKILYSDEIDDLPENNMPDLKDGSGKCACISPEDTLAIIYTSGTTGRPKGSLLANRSLVAFCHSLWEKMYIDESSKVASYASFGFDAGLQDIVTILTRGAALYIIPDEIRLDISKVEEFYCKNKITQGFMTTQVGRMFASETKDDALKAFMVGGEKLVPFTPREGFDFINAYGPCETMGFVCSHVVKDAGILQPIGKPSRNTKLYITDKYERLLPVGASGEFCIATRQMGKGYLNLPEKTEAAFVKNPFSDLPDYTKMYKTGDVVRLLPAGEFEFIGRRDGQVKVRGFRVELTEVEEVIRRFDGIKDATVAAFDDAAGGKYIAAYVTSDYKVDEKALKDFIRSEKPDYMVPRVIMQLDAIPYNQNQKVNRRALPEPDKKAISGEILPPENDIQKKLFKMAAEILGYDGFGITTDLFEAGLTSIGVLKLNADIGKEFKKPVRFSDIKENSTIKEIAEFISAGESNQSFESRKDYPLMQNQMGIFVEEETLSGSTRYNIPSLFKISEKLDVEKLKAAVEAAIDAHPYIKATLTGDRSGNVRALRNDSEMPLVQIIKVDNLPEVNDLVRPFNLLGDKLYRAFIYVTDEGNYLFLDIHHIISDGTSIKILLDDIERAYAGEKLKIEEFTGFDAALEEEKLLNSEERLKSEKYYEEFLSGCSTDNLPAKCPENKEESSGLEFEISFGEASKAIKKYCAKNGFSENAFFNAAFAFTLSEFLHADDVTYCTVYNGRADFRTIGCFAMLVRTLPVRCMTDMKAKVYDYVKEMQKQLMDTMSNDAESFADVSTKHGISSDIFFNYQGDNFIFDHIAGEPAEAIPAELSGAKAPLSIEAFLNDGIYSAKASYREDYFCREFAESFLRSLLRAAIEFTEADELSSVSIISDEEKNAFDVMNDTEVPFEKLPAQRFFENHAKLNPEKTAVKTVDGTLSYKELDENANRVANALIKLGVKADDIVGFVLERTIYVPVIELGVLKSGGAFLPMLPSYPDERLEFSITDAECSFVITTKDVLESHKELFSEEKSYRALLVEELLEEENTSRPDIEFSMSQLAYCIYTSGSTGRPKGVMIEHHNLANYFQTAAEIGIYELGNVMLCMASFSFDMSITEIQLSLSRGSTIYIASEEEIHNFDLLLSAFVENKIDMAFATPSFVWSLISIPQFRPALEQLKAIELGAEAFQPALFNKLKAINPDIVIKNGYGPTECTMSCSTKLIEDPENVTIGGPHANTQFYVADVNGNLLPRYAVGELLIGGEGVGRGYVKLPEKNEAAFGLINGSRFYHSGDLVRVNKDNEVEFAGRADNQVKLRGFRIELDEVEAVMQEYEGVSQSKVVVRNNGTEDFLAGFFTAETKVDVNDLRDFMKTRLTYYMVPAALMQLDKMPLTPNGKLDKKALPEVIVTKKERSRKAPKKSLEEKIVELFRSVLNTEECYVDDNFFEIGGTSLSASKAVMQLKAEGYKIEYQDIFDHQSAEELAEYLESLKNPVLESKIKQDEDLRPAQDEDITEALKYNEMKYAEQTEREPLGDVVLTGVTGFLGIHVLKELLDNETGRVICIMRKGVYDDLETRLESTFFYYFDNGLDDSMNKRIILLEGDITDDNLTEKFKDINFDTLINCAACVKHYANDDSIEFVNVHGVENLIKVVKEKNARFIQISTTSVPGTHTDETYKYNLTMAENQLFVVDDMNNQYIGSKYKAELKILQAIREGMRGKIIRVGNLMGRLSDGEFQVNSHTNAFLNGMRGFAFIGKCPYSHATDPMSFSPIDCTAKAVVLLAGTNDMFTAFNAQSRAVFDEMQLFEVLNKCGISVKPVNDKEYYEEFYRMMADEGKNEKVSALLTNDRPGLHSVEVDTRFTANVLYRLGFIWPFIDAAYLEKVIRGLDELNFFDM